MRDENAWWASSATACRLPGTPLLDSTPQFSQEPKPQSEPRKYGLKGITSLGRKMVQSGVTVLANKCGLQNLSFLTLTVPPLTQSQRQAVAASWGETTRQLLQWLARRLKSAGLHSGVVSASEIQPKRLRKLGQGYLHLHAVFQGRLSRYAEWAVRVEDIRAWWEARLKRVLKVDQLQTTQINIQGVKKNVAGYLAKYLSKGGEGLEEYRKDCGDEGVPGQWWNMTKAARDMTKAAVLKCPELGLVLEQMVESFFDGWLGDWPGGIKHVERLIGDALMTIAYYGWLTEYAMKDVKELTAMLKSRLIEI